MTEEFGEFLKFRDDINIDDQEYKEDFEEWIPLAKIDVKESPRYQEIANVIAQRKQKEEIKK